MKIATLIFLLLIINPLLWAQSTQTIRGRIVDKETHYPLTGVTVKLLLGNEMKTGTASDDEGRFSLTGIALGRYAIEFSYLGYENVRLNNIQLQSAKEVILQIEMEETVTQAKEVVIKSGAKNGNPGNEMAVVSARSFTVEETDRFAGSRGDPSRMASNFAGVQGADDSRNDIIIRGNSPAGVLWRCEGIDIPNPNHFAIPGTTGGPVNIINNKILANSDFYTGAFPAEFGNATAGVFDLRLRPGNNKKREHSFQFGFLGTELFSEGPINKESGASYLVGYRYSSLALFGALNLDVGTNALPIYQDASFKLNFRLKNNANLSFWGIGGHSAIDIKISEQSEEERNIYGENDRDQYFTSYLFASGLSYKKSLNNKTFINLSAAAHSQTVDVLHNYLFYNKTRDTLLNFDPLLQYRFRTNVVATHFMLNRKVNNKLTIKTGIMADFSFYHFHDSARAVILDSNGQGSLNPWVVRWDSDMGSVLIRPYFQAKYKFSARTFVNFGLSVQYFSLSNSISFFEPRIAIKHDLDTKSSLSFGAGLHSQSQSPYIYLYKQPGTKENYNQNIDFTRSLHLVGGYDRFLGKNTKIKAETYFQYLYRIPVEQKVSSFSLINSGSGFSRFFPDTLTNTGIGRNVGLELTLERFFAGNFYFLVTASLFDAKYQGSDKIWRNTDFNGRYAINTLITKEFQISNKRSFQIGGKLTTTGGRYFSPADTALSNSRSELIEIASEKNTLKTPAYFRFDIRVSHKWNTSKVSHEFALDLINVLNTKNVLSLAYAPDGTGNNIRYNYQLGFLPLFYYKLDF